MTMTLIQTTTLGTAASSIEFTSIPQTFTDLFAFISGRSASATNDDGIRIRFNFDTTAGNYTARRLFGTGTTTGSDTLYTGTVAFTGSGRTANTFANTSIYIPNYTSSTSKGFSVDGVSENNASSSTLGLSALSWVGTAAITSITFFPDTGPTLFAGSTISLYGITKGSDGIVTTSP
jgi:hypothetical protein